MSLSEEQASIVRKVCASSDDSPHFVVQARAGSGKTFVALNIASELHSRTLRKTLLATYSSPLRADVTERCIREGRGHTILVDTFHTLVTTVFGAPVCRDDTGIQDFLSRHPVEAPFRCDFGCLIVDEVQDMVPLYADIVKLVLETARRHRIPLKLVFMGDFFQSIFWYRQPPGSSASKYMLFPEAEFGGQWLTLYMNTAFRTPPQIVEWINTNLHPAALRKHYPGIWAEFGDAIERLWGDGMQSSPTHPAHGLPRDKVLQHITYNSHHVTDATLDAIDTALVKIGFCGNDTELSVLVRGHQPDGIAQRIVNDSILSTMPWYIKSPHEGSHVDPRAYARKCSVGTVHSMKGKETKYVVAVGVSVVSELCASTTPDTEGSERKASASHALEEYFLTYVQCTRASRGMIIAQQGQVPFFTMREEVIDPIMLTFNRSTHMSVDAYLRAYETNGSGGASGEHGSTCNLTCTLRQALPPIRAFADICWIHGTRTGTFENIRELLTGAIDIALRHFIQKAFVLYKTTDWADAVYLATIAYGSRTGYLHYIRQIPQSYTWLRADVMQLVLRQYIRMLGEVTEASEVEYAPSRAREHIRFEQCLVHKSRPVMFTCDWSDGTSVPWKRIAMCMTAFQRIQCYIINPCMGTVRLVSAPAIG